LQIGNEKRLQGASEDLRKPSRRGERTTFDTRLESYSQSQVGAIPKKPVVALKQQAVAFTLPQ